MAGRSDKPFALSPKSLGIQLFGITFAGIVILVSILGFASYSMSKSILKEKVAQASRETLEQATDKLDLLLTTYAGFTRQFLVDTALRDNLVAFSGTDTPLPEKQAAQDQITDRINSMVSSESNILAIRLIPVSLDNSKALSSTGSSSLQISETGKIWLKKMIAANGDVVFVPTLKKGLFGYSPEPALTVGRLLKNLQNPDAEFLLLIELRGKALADIFANSRIGEDGALMTATDDNKVAYAADSEWIEQPLPPLNTRDTLVLEQPSQAAPWRMIGTVPVGDLVRDSGRILQLTLWMAALAVLAALLIGYLLARKVSRPLGKLCSLMEEGEHGNLSVRMEQRGPSEIARLARHFNRMMEQIGQIVTRSNLSALQLVRTAKELKTVSEDTAGSAREIAHVARLISEGASTLAEEAEHGIALTEAIGGKVSAVTETYARLEASAARVRADSDRGTLSMLGLIDKTSKTDDLSNSLSAKVGKLKESADSVLTLMNLMNEISKKTNILSLNASIEAARAGTLGKSFVVVAGEIRNLAEQSKQSIGVVQRITDDILTGIDGTAAELGTIAPLLREQNTAVKEASDIFAEVQNQMGSFVREIEQSATSVTAWDESQRTLAVSIGNVSAFSQHSASSTEEVAALTAGQLTASDKLVALSDELELLSEQLLEALVQFGKPGSV